MVSLYFLIQPVFMVLFLDPTFEPPTAGKHVYSVLAIALLRLKVQNNMLYLPSTHQVSVL